jgi:predicted dehydrogenase
VHELLARADLDAIVVVLPVSAYGSVVRACLERGLPVFAEKPAAGSANEAAELAECARRGGVPAMVGYMKRFAPAYRRAKALMSEPSFGPPSLVSLRWAVGQYGGSCSLRDWLVENPVHHLDLARFLVGELEDPDVCFARVQGGEFVVAVQARSTSGAVVSLRLCTTASWEHENEAIEVFGRGSSLLVENVDTLRVRPPARPEHVWRPNYTVHGRENQSVFVAGFVPALEHFRAVVTEGVPCESDLENAEKTLRLAEAILGGADP